ncbi:MAG: hypothetical protein ACI8V2_003899 [Candidatus Latescibacterota bacterium]|jgi:hypothetical protein
MKRPTDVERQEWEDNGVLFLESAIVGEELTRLQALFDRSAAEAKEDWLAGIAKGTKPAAHFDIPNPLEKDDFFIDLIDHPSWYGYLMAFADEDLILLGPQVRTLPVLPISYVGWHPDVPHTTPLHMKVQIYVEDVPANGGAFGYVPGSHKPNAGACPVVRPLDTMPGHKVYPGKAGDVVLFNSYGWHTSMVNTSINPRKSIILIYEKWSKDRVATDRYVGIADKCTTPDRRRLFSLDAR